MDKSVPSKAIELMEPKVYEEDDAEFEVLKNEAFDLMRFLDEDRSARRMTDMAVVAKGGKEFPVHR